jgi:hypothetical protein
MNILQTLLALVVLIYVLCVIVQFLQEGVKALLGTKAKTMEKVIETFMGTSLLTPEQVKVALNNRGFETLAALEQFNKEDFRSLLDTIPFTSDQIKQVPQILGAADASITQFKDHAEASYDAAIAKFQRLYSANNKKWVIGISFVVVLALNASAVKMYEILAIDPAVEQAIAATASSVGQSNQGGGAPQALDPEKTRQAITRELHDYPILLRTMEYPTDVKNAANDFGLILMGLLVSLGAPFWNDVLKGMTGVNNALNTGGQKTS